MFPKLLALASLLSTMQKLVQPLLNMARAAALAAPPAPYINALLTLSLMSSISALTSVLYPMRRFPSTLTVLTARMSFA